MLKDPHKPAGCNFKLLMTGHQVDSTGPRIHRNYSQITWYPISISVISFLDINYYIFMLQKLSVSMSDSNVIYHFSGT